MSTARPVALSAPPPGDAPFDLATDEAHHLARVLRVRPGDGLRLFYGGEQWTGEVVEVSGGQVRVRALEPLPVPDRLPADLWWALPALKGGHTEDLLRHLTEAGAAGFLLMDCQRAISRHEPKKRDRLEKVLVEAAKQSGRAEVPRLLDGSSAGQAGSPLTLHSIVPRICPSEFPSETPVHTFVAAEHCPPDAPTLSQALASCLSPDKGRPVFIIASGPEGGWAPEELAAAAQAHWQIVTLGPLVLRAETAPLIACGAALAALSIA
jgi:16S rRNA (uracil1498-N3)-methyltransferase